MTYLCLVLSTSGATLAEYTIEANNEPFARWKTKQLYGYQDHEYTIDVLGV